MSNWENTAKDFWDNNGGSATPEEVKAVMDFYTMTEDEAKYLLEHTPKHKRDQNLRRFEALKKLEPKED